MHLFFYTIFCRLYVLGIRLVALWNPKARKWLQGRRGLFEKIGREMASLRLPGDAPQPLVWMHCASLGEFEQGRPVLEQVRARYPSATLLLTFFSPSGYEIRKDYPGADLVFYLPMDGKANARRFLEMVQPSLVIWVKYEYWYFYLTSLKKRKIPALLVSAIFRKEQPFFKWYGRLHQYMLTCFQHLFVQTEQSKSLLAGIGFREVTVNGDTRFDRVMEIANQFTPLPLIQQFCSSYPVIVAGSTWDEDEEELDHFANTHPAVRFIIAPHEIHESHLQDIEKLFKHSVRYSQLQQQELNADVNTLIIDNIGMLSRLYRYATVTFIGGGFGEDGVHNVLEAAVYGKPVVFGPVYDKYVEAVELLEAGGGFSIGTALELEALFNQLLTDTAYCNAVGEKAGNYVKAKTGATAAVLQYIQEKRLLTS